jgi:hypothetical protein
MVRADRISLVEPEFVNNVRLVGLLIVSSLGLRIKLGESATTLLDRLRCAHGVVPSNRFAPRIVERNPEAKTSGLEPARYRRCYLAHFVPAIRGRLQNSKMEMMFVYRSRGGERDNKCE